MNIIVDTLFYTKEAQEQINGGVDRAQFQNKKNTYYEKCVFNSDMVESATPSRQFKNHTEILMVSGDTWLIKIALIDYARLIEHIDAEKFLCKIKN